MKKKYRWFIGLFSFIPVLTFSCADYSKQNELNRLISKYDEVSTVLDTNNLRNTNEILDRLLNDAFKSDQTKIVEYKKQQIDNKDKILKEYFELTKDFSKSSSKKEFALKQSEFFSNNWYFFLTNLDKFEFNFVEYIYTDLSKGYKTSDEYKKIIDLKTAKGGHKKFSFFDSYLDEIREGIEAKELGDATVYYVKKDRLVFRIIVDNLRSENNEPKVILRPINWYFNDSVAITISLGLVSEVIHQLFIHGYDNGRIDFETEMVKNQKYGSPSFVFPTVKEKMIEG
ncbi:aromatic motif membrane protein [Mycoplasmopsis cynos]|uniref:Aromatic motif membrane protein n=2 Tax=Mycoplasmopsis cynos TaxID=171284 RepID=A0A449AIE6_9BACT|nr:aromatic motif membrane protein [Mycoplasmopsis cynos]MCU9933331.1 hypothetical protein [Mycoplasmopsis cynos]MCU9935589.1 hypothetical protein [Mycoplasmopsis cynos]WQQ14978.1 aromatic motif membrane protein [Mycoplasmopsis cynos]WQQ17767.1 aromatic motif membrane protein [Mycoplasmopsis cynos]WQQ20308.1 aromatic motif membrane protein [Mycoplasmopsis cynos]